MHLPCCANAPTRVLADPLAPRDALTTVASRRVVLQRLHHRNVIQLVDVLFNWEKQKIYLFMEYCAATLMEVLDCAEGKRLPLHQAQDYFRQLMCGLDYVHSQVRLLPAYPCAPPARRVFGLLCNWALPAPPRCRG